MYRLKLLGAFPLRWALFFDEDDEDKEDDADFFGRRDFGVFAARFDAGVTAFFPRRSFDLIAGLAFIFLDDCVSRLAIVYCGWNCFEQKIGRTKESAAEKTH